MRITQRMVEEAMSSARKSGIPMPYSASIRDYPDLAELHLQDRIADYKNREVFYNILKSALDAAPKDDEVSIWIWTPIHGAKPWSTLPSLMGKDDGRSDEEKLAQSLQSIEDHHHKGPSPDYIYFFATEGEMTDEDR